MQQRHSYRSQKQLLLVKYSIFAHFDDTRGFPKLASGGYPAVQYGRGTDRSVPGAQLNAGDCRKNDSEGLF